MSVSNKTKFLAVTILSTAISGPAFLSKNFDPLGFLVIEGSFVGISLLAIKKNRSLWKWALLTCFSGPFVFIVFLLRTRRKEIRHSIVAPEPSSAGGAQATYTASSIGEERVPDPNSGYIYVISNPAFAEKMVKIGFTTRKPEERLDELDQAGLPTEYIEHYRIYTKDARKLEKRLHEYFAAQRFRPDKEFFKVEPYEVYQVLLKWGVEPLEI